MKNFSLTKTQLGIYVESVSNPVDPLYNITFLTKLSAEADLKKLAAAIEQVAAVHSLFRLRFATDEEGMPCQYLAENADLDLKIEQMSDAEFEVCRAKWPQRMPLENAPLAHFRLFETPSAKWFYQTYHHSVFDGTSAAVVAEELRRALNGEPLLGETVSIVDLAEREEQQRQTLAFEEAKCWYADNFGGIDADTMPLRNIDSHSDDAKTPQTVTFSHVLDAKYSEIFAKSRSLGVKMSILADGAFAYTAGMFVGANESLFATVYSGRKAADEANTLAMMVKTLPVYARWDAETTVADFLHHLQTQREGAKQHDIYSFGEICTELGLKHNLMFSYRGSLHGDRFEMGDWVENHRDLSLLNSGEGVTWVLDHVDGKLKLTAEYRADHFSAELIESVATAYDFVLQQMISAEKLAEISLVDAEKQLEIDQKWHTELAYDRTKSLVDLWRDQAEKTPDKTAVVAGETRLTYGEIDVLSDNLAAYLHAAGIGRGDVVAILIPRNEFMTIASLGAMKTGAAYQPLDPSYPTERLNFMVKDSAAKCLITEEDLQEKISDFGGKILLTSEIPNLKKAEESEILPYKPQPSDRMILLYTSGSTGTPKGCQLSHANLVSFVNAIQPIFHYDTESNVTAYASYGFDANMFDQYPGLTHGATIHIIGEEIRFDLVALNDYFAKEKITHAFMTTQVARAYATSVDVPKTLKFLTCGGEALVPIDKPETFEMLNAYGPTETTVFVTKQPLDQTYDRIPIGEALPNVRLYVADKNGHLLPPLATGELLISGPQVAMGYLNRPEKTAESFIENPFTNDENFRRIYRTGDTVRRLADGRIDFIGRNDGQVKVRGFRIELSEVEAVVREFQDITDATVVAYDDPAGGKFVAAYIVSEKTIDIAALNTFIAERKPPYMVPAVTMQIEKIPLNQNQKVDKRALPKPELQAAQTPENSAPRTANALEKALQEIVGSVLKKEEIDLATPLELLGLTSISSIKLAMAIYKRFGIDLKTSELLGLTTIETIENKLLERWLAGENLVEKADEKTEKKADEKLPLTISQQGVYADCMRNPESTTYNIPLLYRFPKSFSAEKLANAIRKIFESHRYLQTYFTLSGADVEQAISAENEVKIEQKAMSEAEFADFKRTFVRPFNLLKAPLYRIAIVATETALNLLIDIHHIIFDGTSVSVVLGELQTLLNGGNLAKESTNYHDYIRKELATDQNKAKQFFAELLKDCEAASEITPDLPQAANGETGDSVELYELLDFEAIDAFCRQHHITPAALTLAATGYAVSRFTNTHTAYLNTVSTGRNDVHFADTIGMFVKTLPVAIDVADVSAAEFAEQTNTMLRSVVEHEIYPYSTICRDYNYAPNIMFEYQLGLEENIVVEGEIITREVFGSDSLKFKIAVRIELRNGQPAVIVYYKNGLYSENLMRALARSIALVAERICKNPNEKARKISMLGEGDLKQLKQFSATQLNYNVPIKLFHQMFEHQADKSPEKEILAAIDGKFTYKELENRANRVANALIINGLQRGESVVVLLHRTSNYFSAVFGISKAGGVFIPTNPDYPQERINTIVEDSGAKFIITEGDLLKMYEKSVDVAELIAHENATRPNIAVQPTDKVYMIYTSGSTGKPKGVELRHESICNYLTDHETNLQVNLPLNNGSCYGAVTTVAFDMSFKEWALALCNGMKLVFASDEATLDPMILAKELSENGVDVFNATPSRLLQYMEVESFAKVIANCKVILSGGEKYPSKLLNLLKEKTNAIILNTYGPTEITVSSNAANLSKTDTISVGRPLLNYEEFIVDSDDNLLPVGVVGELIICGVGVGDGYHNLPEQTAKAFITFQGKSAYRSGDYARWLTDGCVEILGRKDNQVKLRGLRIELGEIERVLTNVEGVKSGTVLIRKVGNQEAICAYYTLADGVSLTSEEIKTTMAASLTDYMVPTAFVEMDEMPLTPNGKTNIKALPEPKAMERAKGREPETDAEKLFAKIFAEILETDTVYADDNFFEIGGSSLTVTRVIIAASKAGMDLAYADVFDNPTPGKLAILTSPAEKEKPTTLYADFEDIGKYDYQKINKLLANNTLESFVNGKQQTFSHVLLTGATGFLGIHMLYELLHNYPTCRVTCLLRGKGDVDAKSRMNGMFFYYFEELPSELFGDRLAVADGDITQKEAFEQCKNLGIDLVINCAANVKHFSKGTDIEDVNYYGTLNIIDFCKTINARLVHVSTMSVGGAFVGVQGGVSELHENMLYFGQKQLSKYTQSKYLAERAILQAVADGELSAKIMRVGTLAPRNKDGEYQINFGTNSFMARLKSTYLVGAHSFESEIATFELSPIDAVAQAILLLANSPKENVVFHPFNNHQLLMGDLYDTMTQLGLPSTAVEEADYQAALEEAEQDPAKARVLTGLLAYRQGHGIKTYNVGKASPLTVAVLSRLGFHWPVTSNAYTERFIVALRGLGFFDE